MSRDHTQYLLTFVLGFLGLRALQVAFGSDTAVWILIFGVPIAQFIVWLSGRVSRRVDAWQATQILRSLPKHERDRVLAGLTHDLRDDLVEGIRRDGSETSEAAVERFPFPARSIRLASLGHALLIAVGVVVLGIVSTGMRMQSPLRYVLVAIGIACLPASLVAARLQRRLISVIEVSPFQVTEISADGSRVVLSFNQSLVLLNQPRRRRFLIGPAELSARLRLDYGRMGFRRLIESVITYAGFAVQPNEEL